MLIFGCLCCLILLKAYAAYALFTFLAVVLVLIVGTLVNKVYWKGWYVGYDYEDAFYTGDVKRWGRALRQKCLRCFSSRAKREKVQPVIGANSSSSNDEAAAYKVDDDSDELSSTSEEYSEADLQLMVVKVAEMSRAICEKSSRISADIASFEADVQRFHDFCVEELFSF